MKTWKIIILSSFSMILASVTIIARRGISVGHCLIIALAVANIVISVLGIRKNKNRDKEKQENTEVSH